MPRNSFNDAFRNARNVKNDEFYTIYEDIESELSEYDFTGKTIYCPCDDYRKSGFVKWFKNNFERCNIKLLISTNYDIEDGAYEYRYDGNNEIIKKIDDGDFRSDNTKNIMKYEADVIVTNPPFSIYREYMKQILSTGKEFIVIGSLNSFSYNDTIRAFVDDKIGFGYNKSKTGTRVGNHMSYETPSGETKTIPSFWYTNIKHHIPRLITGTKFKDKEYEVFDNAPHIINVDRKKDIPDDYYGYMGVPVTTIPFISRDEFEITGRLQSSTINDINPYGRPYINGKEKFVRIIIKRKENGVEKEC